MEFFTSRFKTVDVVLNLRCLFNAGEETQIPPIV